MQTVFQSYNAAVRVRRPCPRLSVPLGWCDGGTSDWNAARVLRNPDSLPIAVVVFRLNNDLGWRCRQPPNCCDHGPLHRRGGGATTSGFAGLVVATCDRQTQVGKSAHNGLIQSRKL